MSLIAAVEGTLAGVGPDHVLVGVGGVTLQVRVPSHDLADLGPVSSRVRLWTHLVVREDDLQLYGFTSDQARRLFEALLGVNGVGPRVAIGLLSAIRLEAIAAAIVHSDATVLAQAPGVGRRTAERIILDLRGKIEEEFGQMLAAATVQPGSDREPALQALVALGYSLQEARQALAGEHEPGLSTEERVRRALRRSGQ